MMVMTILSVMLVLMVDLVYSSRVNLELAQNAYRDLKASYNAKSAATLALVILKADQVMDEVMANMSNTGKKGKKGEIKTLDSHNDLWKMFSGKPLTQAADLLKALSKIEEGEEMGDGEAAEEGDEFSEEELSNEDELAGDGSIFSTDFIAELKKEESDILFNVSDESKLININALQIKGLDVIIKTLFKRILGGRAETEFLDSKDLTIEKIVGQMIDWVDANDEAKYIGGGENEDYSDMNPRYYVQNAPFDSIEQVRMLACMDDELFELLSPYITVYPRESGKFHINVNTMSRDNLLTLFPEAQENLKEVDLYYSKKAESHQPYFSSVDELKKTLEQFGVMTEDTDVKKMLKYFHVYSDYFRIEAEGEVEDVTKKLTMIVQRKRKKKGGKKGAKVPASQPIDQDEMVEEDSYKFNENFPFKILYWKMER